MQRFDVQTQAATPRMFTELIPSVRARDAEFTETASIPVDTIDVSAGGLIFGENSIPWDEESISRLLGKVRAPVEYLRRHGIDIQILLFREHLRQGHFGNAPKAVVQNNHLFTLQKAGLIELTGSEVLQAVADALGANADGLTVSKISNADGRLEVDLTSHEKVIEVRRGDIVKAGLHIEHSRYGDHATQVHAYSYRLVCENGMTRRECSPTEGIVRTRKLPAGHPGARELQLDQIRRLTARTWDRLGRQLAELKATSERPADVPQLLRQWLQRARMSTRTTDAARSESTRTVLDRLLAAWHMESGEATYYAAVNALTRVGTHDLDLSPRRRRAILLLGGLLAFSGVHLCPKCFSVLSEPAKASEEGVGDAANAYSHHALATG